MLSIPVLIAYAVVIAIYLTGCLIIHLHDVREEKRTHEDGRSGRSVPRHGGPHAIHR